MGNKVGAIELANNLRQAALNHLHSVFGECSVEYLCATEKTDGEIVIITESADGKEFEISVKVKNLLA